ncbi:hypothetical protein CDAR_282741 [Caerostris darwini]|uniref:C2H2-type domain-containing protein n=1 Tax=Caerostris darwini TaxID=1538125 RepID=A0AAV4TTK6_9ARAC|nr:hypothetical protein CDAR_282741 [Caerostris darwini]
MSKDERKFDGFGKISKDKEEDMSLPERLLRAPAGSNGQNHLARRNVGDGSHEPSSGNMQNRPRTGNVMLNDPSSRLFHRISGPGNHMSIEVGAEGGQNVVSSSENVQQSAEYFSFQPTSNKSNIANTQDSLSGCSMRNKQMRYSEINPNESFQKIQSNISTNSNKFSSSVCDVCRKEYSSVASLNRHMLIHSAENPLVLNLSKAFFPILASRSSHACSHRGETAHLRNLPANIYSIVQSQTSRGYSLRNKTASV